MNMTIEEIGNKLKEAITNFLVPLQTVKIVKSEAFEILRQQAEALALSLKDVESVPKHLLNELYVTIQIIRNEAPYAKGEKALLEQMAAKLEMCFALILRNEVSTERKPGVPRIM